MDVKKGAEGFFVIRSVTLSAELTLAAGAGSIRSPFIDPKLLVTTSRER